MSEDLSIGRRGFLGGGLTAVAAASVGGASEALAQQPAKPLPGAVLRVPVDPGSPLRSGLVIEGDVATVGSGSPASSSGTAQEGSQQAPRAAKATPRGPRELYYRVQAGDSLYSVARRFAVTVADLKRWNGLKSNKLRPGQKLLVRVRAAA